jgi:hypothetical protein
LWNVVSVANGLKLAQALVGGKAQSFAVINVAFFSIV